MKRQLAKIAAAFLVLVSAAGTATLAQAQSFTVLHTFAGSPSDGASSQASLIIDTAGNLYGTTAYGGGSTACNFGCGTVFKLDPSGNETVLHNFLGGIDGARPFGGLIMDVAGNLYGTTQGFGFPGFGSCNNSCGNVFKLDPSGNETVLHSFTGGSDGANPAAGLIMDAAGNLYGTAEFGGTFDAGTVFKLDTLRNFSVLHTFTGGLDGALPLGALIMDAAGNLYGTTAEGGGSNNCGPGCGTVFKLDASGNETVLYGFKGQGDGVSPSAALIMDATGNFFGTAFRGGAFGTCPSGCGTVFELDPSGNITVLHTFTGGGDGGNPSGALIMDTARNLYGTTSDNDIGTAGFGGTVFKLDPAHNETVLHNFTGGADGAGPRAALVMDGVGNLYGTASVGGGPSAFGTVFKLAVQAPAPTITSISPTGAIAGGAAFTLTVSGTNFVSGSMVNFNGNTLVTTFASATQLTAAVPGSDIGVAGSFNVTVTNPGGITSNAVSFMVVTPQDATGAIINSVNALFAQGVINGGQDNSLVSQLQHAITLMNAGKNAGSIGNLDSFISEVNDLLSSGVLSPSQAASLVSAAQSVIAAI